MQFLKKLNRQERVVEEVKVALKPHYTKKLISKEEYKEILRRAVPKVVVQLIRIIRFKFFVFFRFATTRAGKSTRQKSKVSLMSM